MLTKQIKEQMAFPLKYKDLGQIKLPKLKYKRGAKLTKNPYKIKKIPLFDESKRPKRILDGYAIIEEARCEFPNDVIQIKLSKKNMVSTKVEDLGWFIYLVSLDISENELALEDFVYLTGLQTLNISANKIQTLALAENVTFKNLENLDLSFNHIQPLSIETLAHIPLLKKLSLESNDLKELPPSMANFVNLEELNLSGNLFESDMSASNLWYTLASIKKLKVLDLSRNILRGIHTERLVAGNFMSLKVLDFSYNAVENQHNLICARNFRNLVKLIISGNPFSVKNEHKGLEMEVYARTGALVINEEVEKFYLKQKTDKNRFKIKFDNIRKIEKDDFEKERNYFLGVEMPPANEIQEQEQQHGYQEEENEEEEEEPKNVEEQEPAMFMTEDPNLKISQKQPSQRSAQRINGSMELNGKQSGSNMQQNSIQSKGSLGKINGSKMSYEEFIDAAREHLGDNKEYEQHFDLNTAYKTLKNMVKRNDPLESQELDEPHYLKPTSTIQRYKFKEQSSLLIQADQVELYEKRKQLMATMAAKEESNAQKVSKKKIQQQQNSQTEEEKPLKKKNSSDEVVQDIAKLF